MNGDVFPVPRDKKRSDRVTSTATEMIRTFHELRVAPSTPFHPSSQPSNEEATITTYPIACKSIRGHLSSDSKIFQSGRNQCFPLFQTGPVALKRLPFVLFGPGLPLTLSLHLTFNSALIRMTPPPEPSSHGPATTSGHCATPC